jgi:heme exporter protein B
MLKTIYFVFHTELTLRLRRSQEWLYPLSFFVIIVCFFPLAFTPDPRLLQKLVPGGLWIAALLASLFSMEHLFLTDIEDGHLEQLLLSPLPLTGLVAAKWCAQWVTIALPLLLLTPLLGYLFHLPTSTLLTTCISLLLGTPILTLIGSFGVALTWGLRQPGVLLSSLILPLVTPVLILGVASSQSTASLSTQTSLILLAGLCLFAFTLLPWAIAATLRISMDE